MKKQAKGNDNKISQGEIKKSFEKLRKPKFKKGKVINLPSPDGPWISNIPFPGPHIQGVSISACENYLVLTSNQKKKYGYIALCQNTKNNVYRCIDTKPIFITSNNTDHHPGGIQIFNNGEEYWIVAPFEFGGGYKPRDNSKLSDPTKKIDKSIIRFYKIQNDEMMECPALTINRDKGKAGSVGITGDENRGFLLAVADKKNQVDFYKGNLEEGFGDCFARMEKDDDRMEFVNSFSLLKGDDKGCYLLGLEKNQSCLYKIVFKRKNATVEWQSEQPIDFGKEIGAGFNDPSFRWGGNAILTDNKLSLVATERIIRSMDEKNSDGKWLGKAKLKIVRPKNNTPYSPSPLDSVS